MGHGNDASILKDSVDKTVEIGEQAGVVEVIWSVQAAVKVESVETVGAVRTDKAVEVIETVEHWTGLTLSMAGGGDHFGHTFQILSHTFKRVQVQFWKFLTFPK